ncbi:hypothetical protein BSZ39_03045 [Bowdeniella nasicola]|uniref:Uncharacterized protein n=1 Tax=Bowdeniella nasicola TaxID=208480 RepID=A0A1Q5Q4D3_9ACTO|nr:hypothetical protein BSZ39_03045 [Bowdeniella nasicola]
MTRRELRRQWETEQANKPLTRREIRQREAEEEARRKAIATGELTLTEAFTLDGDIDGELTPPRPPRAEGEAEPTRRSLRDALADRLDEDEQAGRVVRGPKHRTIAPPSTAQGVRIVDHATGEIKTLRPEQYEPATSTSSLGIELPPPEPKSEPVEEAVEEPADEPVSDDEPAPEEPERVSMFAAAKPEEQAAEADEEDEKQLTLSRRDLRAAKGAPEHAGFPLDDAESTSSPEPSRRWIQIVLVIIAVIVLAVIVYFAVQQVQPTAAANPLTDQVISALNPPGE